MEEKIITRVPAEQVWKAWEEAHETHGNGALNVGKKGRSSTQNGKGFVYEIHDVVKGKSFSLIWKTLFVRLIFSHQVTPIHRGSEICYSISIKGPFAWPVRWLLGGKIRSNVRQVLKTMVARLEI